MSQNGMKLNLMVLMTCLLFLLPAEAVVRSPANANSVEQHATADGRSGQETDISALLISDYGYMKEHETKVDLNNLIPNDLTNGQDANSAAGRIADKSLQYWWNNSEFKNSDLGASVQKAQDNMQTDVNLGSSGDSGINHKLNMGFDLFQSKARVKYEGFANAEVFYRANDSSAGMQINKKLDSTKDISLGETLRSSDSSSEVKFKWNW